MELIPAKELILAAELIPAKEPILAAELIPARELTSVKSPLLRWLETTAWPMTPPLPFSAFHLLFALIGIPACALLARKLRRLTEKACLRLFFGCGVILAASESYKQLFLFYIVNGGHYDWWYFPFQLCSLPMYLCLALPFLSRPWKRILCTFMYNYNLMGALMVFLDPSGLMHPYWTLTLHSFLWHLILIFLGLLAAFSGMASASLRDFGRATLLFAICCLIATAINVAAHPLGNADMFYITPYYPTPQLFFSRIAARFGIMAGNASYLCAIQAGAFLMRLLLGHFAARV